MKVLMIDNYDSFTYNLVYLIRQCGAGSIDVMRNNELQMETPAAYDKLIFSPGPGIPEEAGLMLDLIKEYAAKKPILGVCLGHQAIGEVFGSKLKNIAKVYHGVATDVTIQKTGDYLFKGIPATFKAGRYHSWVIDENNVSDELEVTATEDNGLIMAIAHKKYDIRGLQFHPESVLTEHAPVFIQNWLKQ